MGAILSVSGALKARAKESCSPELIEVGLPLPPPPSGAKVSPPSTPPLARGSSSTTQVRRRVDHLSLAVDDEDDPHWRDACRRDHEAMMTRMQYEVNDRKGIGWERVIDDSQGFWWHEHGMLACFHDRPLESSRAYRESLRVEPKGQYALGALLSLGRVYLGQGLFAEAERAFGELYDGMSRAAERQEFVGKGSTVQATRLLQLSASAQAAPAAGGAAGDADAAAAERQMVELLCGELARLAKMASIKPWAAQSCADSPHWPAAFTDAAAKTFGKKKYVKLSNVLPPRLLRFMQGWYRYLSDEDGGGVAEANRIWGYEKRWLAKCARPPRPPPHTTARPEPAIDSHLSLSRARVQVQPVRAAARPPVRDAEHRAEPRREPRRARAARAVVRLPDPLPARRQHRVAH